MLRVYKMRHIPTRLFYQPVKGRSAGGLSSLCERGKLYEARKPSLKDIGSLRVSDSLIKKYDFLKENSVDTSWHRGQMHIEVVPEDWEVVEYELTEIKEK